MSGIFMPFCKIQKGVFIMENKDYERIEKAISYHFENRDLLQQAFIRRSYSQENGGENNEVLEFIGDKVLDFIVIKLLAEKFGNYTSGSYKEFSSDYKEGKLTEIKKRLVQRQTLANQIDMLGFADFLILGKGDQKKHVYNQESVKEDLFEAILGAVALDCKWNISAMQEVVELMLDPDGYLYDGNDNYVQMIQDWAAQNGEDFPIFEIDRANYYNLGCSNFIMRPICCTLGTGECKYYCDICLKNNNLHFRDYGPSKSEARKNACKFAYEYLEKEDLLFTIRDEIDNPCEEMAINQLETLARRGYFSIPQYSFEQSYDESGNPIWHCECQISEYENYYWSDASSKKEAKKSAAFCMLQHVLK